MVATQLVGSIAETGSSMVAVGMTVLADLEVGLACGSAGARN